MFHLLKVLIVSYWVQRTLKSLSISWRISDIFLLYRLNMVFQSLTIFHLQEKFLEDLRLVYFQEGNQEFDEYGWHLLANKGILHANFLVKLIRKSPKEFEELKWLLTEWWQIRVFALEFVLTDVISHVGLHVIQNLDDKIVHVEHYIWLQIHRRENGKVLITLMSPLSFHQVAHHFWSRFTNQWKEILYLLNVFNVLFVIWTDFYFT